MSEKYKVLNSSVPNFITITVVGWVDIFIRKTYCEILDDALNYCIKNKGLIVHAYVYMTNHIHLIVSAENAELNEIIRDFKKHTSKEIAKALNSPKESRRKWMFKKFEYEAKRTGRAKNYKLWHDGFHPVILDTNKKREQRIRYTHYNPVAAGFVRHERDWLNSSYKAYEDEKPLLNVKVETLW